MARRKSRRKNESAPKKPAEFENRPLVSLRDLAREAAEQKALAEDRPPSRPRPPEPLVADEGKDEEVLFAAAVSDVRPIGGRSDHLPPEPPLRLPPPVVEQEEDEVLQALQDLVAGDAPLSVYETDEAIEGLSEGQDSRLLRRLKRGEFSVQDHLDLHGLSREEAKPEVARFLLDAIDHGLRCVLLIHGRGHGSKDKVPVLKLALQSWLLRSGIRKHILAFCTARPCDGGAGALYVLLRRSR